MLQQYVHLVHLLAHLKLLKKEINIIKNILGKSVLNAVNLINKKISKKLKDQNIHDQERIDTLLINLDGTRQKSNLGANAILAVSIATKKLSAKNKKKTSL